MDTALHRILVTATLLMPILAGAQTDIPTERVHSDPADNQAVANSGYHATGIIPCVMKAAQPMGRCEFGVRRQGGGTGIVTITRPDRSTLYVVYENGAIISAGGDASFTAESDGESFQTSREANLQHLSVGDERYEIPDAVIYGD